MNIENFSTANLPGLADLGDTKNWASIKGDDPGPKGPIGTAGCSATGVGSGNLTSTTSNWYIPSTGIYTNSITVSSSNPYTYGTIKTERLPMSEELYLYITGGKSCISTAPPTWNSSGELSLACKRFPSTFYRRWLWTILSYKILYWFWTRYNLHISYYKWI